MALLPRALRPSVIIRRRAIWSGLLGPSTFWKIVAAFVFGRSTIKKMFGKSVETISTETVGASSFVNVINAKPLTARQRKAAGVTKAALKAQASADVAASWQSKAAQSSKRKVHRRAEKTAAMAAADRRAATKAAGRRA